MITSGFRNAKHIKSVIIRESIIYNWGDTIMADWNDLKKAFEKDLNKQVQQFVMDEQSLLESIAKYLAKTKGTSALQGYDTDEMLAFLQKPTSEIKSAIGSEWEKLDNSQLETIIYSLTKKVQKSIPLLDRTRKL